MDNITIDCSSIRNREEFHRIFAQMLSFPDWYGNNLDALHDCLSSMCGTVRLINWESAEAALGKYGVSAKRAMIAATLENAELDLIF